MEKSKIIEFLGSKKQYEEYKNLVINELKRQIQSNGLTQHFDERTNVYEEFAEMYLQGWMHSKKELIDELNELKNKVFSEEEIREYIKENPIIFKKYKVKKKIRRRSLWRCIFRTSNFN